VYVQRCLAVMDLRLAACIAPAPNTSPHVLELNRLWARVEAARGALFVGSVGPWRR
jgi:hypothetical protein